jgi:alcohol/geraniol dehydrogenase (NADP+)
MRKGDAMNYKAWIAKSAKQPMVLESVDLGPLGAEDVEVAVEHCGVCHSDLSVFNNEWGISQYPAILGHEVVGRVTAMGPNTKGPRVGQRVGVGWYSSSCMHCHQCMSGSHHLCPQVQATIVGHRGGFATHIRAHWAWVIPLPEKLNFAEAGPLLCGGITVFAPLAMYAKPTDRVGIIGIGGLGHMAVKFAAAYGCDVLWHIGCSGSLCNSRHMNQGVLEVRLVLTRILFVAMKESDGPVEIVPTIFRVRLDEISNH